LKKIPGLLYLIAFFLLLASVVHFLGLVSLFKSWNWLRAFEIDPGTFYLAFKNLLLALGFLFSSVALTLRKRLAPGLGSTFTILTAAWFWLDRTLLNQSPLPFSRHIFALVVTLLLLALFLSSFWTLEPYMKQPTPDSTLQGEISDETK
jgi:hypothetical protein